MMNDQTAKADNSKLQLTLVPPELIEAVAVARMYGNMKYHAPDNWKTVEKSRYRDALCRHLIAYLREPYGADPESGIPHLFLLACNVAFLCAFEMTDGTLPSAQKALEQMHVPEQPQPRKGIYG